jgi:hypothetical protein
MEVIRFSETSAEFHWTARSISQVKECFKEDVVFVTDLMAFWRFRIAEQLGIAADFMLKETGLRMRTEFICIGMGFGNGLLWTGYRSITFHKGEADSWLGDWLQDFQEGLCFVTLAIYLATDMIHKVAQILVNIKQSPALTGMFSFKPATEFVKRYQQRCELCIEPMESRFEKCL